MDATITSPTAPTTAATTTTTTTTTATTTTKSTPSIADYGDEIPLNFMEVNYAFSIVVLVTLGFTATIGTFGNVLILIAVLVKRRIRSAESVFVVNLALCDISITLLAEPLSIVAKTVGWRWFAGIPGLCRAIGYMCTISCVGSLMTLTLMSLDRHILICHHTFYDRIFTIRKCMLYCFLVYLFGFFLISFNFFGIGDHSFDYKNYECVWDRMASHDYTIGFSVVLVWVPIVVTGLAYGRTYWFVKKVRATAGKSVGKSPSSTGYTSSAERTVVSEVNASSTSELMKFKDTNKLSVPGRVSNGKKNGTTATASGDTDDASSTTTNTSNNNNRSLGFKLARPLFIIYMVFSTCWIPYSLTVIADRTDSFPHELHAFVVTFAHLNSSFNWLVYYHTHSKLRRAFQDILRCGARRAGSVKPMTRFTETSMRY